MARYSVARSTEGHLGPGRVEVERLSEQLKPIVDAFIAVFNGVPARSRGQLQELEVGLVVTQDGEIAFPSEDMRPSLTLKLSNRQRPPATRSPSSRSSAAKKQDVVEIPASTIEAGDAPSL
jgi:hypothetical protein